MSDAAPFSLLGAQAALRDGRWKMEALAEWCLARAADTAHLNGFVGVDPAPVLRDARAAQGRWQAWQQAPGALPPTVLNGIPLAHKDLFYRPGRVPGCGTRVPVATQGDLEATVLTRLRQAGALDLGPLNLAEFAYGPTGHNALLGTARNPWNADHVCGGSSSGSALAVSSGAVYASLGTDSGGSVRTPASWCNVTSLKPTRGAISLAGVMPLSPSMDTVGLLARQASDLAVLFALLAGADPADARTAGSLTWQGERFAAARRQPLRLGVIDAWFHDQLAPAVAGGLDAARAVWAGALQARVVSVRVRALDLLARRARTLLLAEAWHTHQPLVEQHDSRYDPAVLRRLLAGAALDPGEVQDARAGLSASQADFIEQAFADADMLLLPCTPTAAPRIDASGTGATPDMLARIDGITRCLRPFNYLGLPAMSLPAGFDASGLPFGLQLVGRPGSEAVLLATGERWQQVTDWHLRRPPGLDLQ